MEENMEKKNIRTMENMGNNLKNTIGNMEDMDENIFLKKN